MFAGTGTARADRRGFTLVEMLVTLTVLAILASAIVPIAKTAIQREKELELRRDLRQLREAIDAYKKLADEKKMESEEDGEGYPPDLETLVKGVEIEEAAQEDPEARTAGRTGSGSKKKLIRFLRRIPRDPMTGSTDWGLRSYQDDRDSDVWGEENVYDVYSKSRAKALDGTRYNEW
jgi:general secretion pathway protein G